ncbi:MAG: aminotransferase class V-fold PLP-dependent enzyme [Actinobacteria bacterium]|nr:aminotransferase class V-fold PLP-dependent enzyme [Actinomycetota bacterium]
MIDVAAVRADTPATAERVFLNHAGASPSPAPVLDAVVGHLRDEARLGGYEAAAARAGDLAGVRRSIASLVSCDPTEVALSTSATDAWETAFWSIPWRAGDVVLTCRSEYVTNAVNLLVARDRFGVDVRVVDDDEHGQVDLAAMERHLADPAVRMVSLSHVPTHGGLVNPAAEVGRLCRSAGALFLLDACQSAGQLHLDVGAIGCDILTATGRKYLRGPRGTGFLYVRTGVADTVGADVDPNGSGGATWDAAERYSFPQDATRFERFERSVAATLGLGAAVDYALTLGVETIEARVVELATHLRGALGAVDGVRVQDRGLRRCGIVTFTVEGAASAEVRRLLAAASVSVWVSDAAHARLDMDRRGVADVVRASVHYLNTLEELDRTVELLERIVAGR